MEYSFWNLMEKLYEAKKAYYEKGMSSLTDAEYDALEGSIIAIHGETKFKQWYRVGYCKNIHQIVSQKAKEQKELFRKQFNQKL